MKPLQRFAVSLVALTSVSLFLLNAFASNEDYDEGYLSELPTLDESLVPQIIPEPESISTLEATDLDQPLAMASLPKMKFTQACAPGKRITLAAVGDILLHSPLQIQATKNPARFESLWSEITPSLKKADLTFGNLEGPVAGPVSSSGKFVKDPGFVFDKVAYTSYPQFNYHPSLISDLVSSGFDLVTTANNHAMDRRSLGANQTISNLKDSNLPFTGTHLTTEPETPIYTSIQKNGFKLAFIGCSFSTNGLPDTYSQVLLCFSDAEKIVSTIKTIKKNFDAVFVAPHWGVEYEMTPRTEQKTLAHRFLNAGATAILGSHPHVLQPAEKFVTDDGRETFIIYSLGNFVSGQKQLERRTTLLLYLGLTRTASGTTIINGVRYLPLAFHWGTPITLKEATPNQESMSHELVMRYFDQSRFITRTQALNTTPECE